MTGFSFAQWLKLYESNTEIRQRRFTQEPVDPRQAVVKDIENAQKHYKPGPYPDQLVDDPDKSWSHLAAAATGQKPASIIYYHATSGHPLAQFFDPAGLKRKYLKFV